MDNSLAISSAKSTFLESSLFSSLDRNPCLPAGREPVFGRLDYRWF